VAGRFSDREVTEQDSASLFCVRLAALDRRVLGAARITRVIISLVIFKPNLPFDRSQALSYKPNSYPQPINPVDNSVENFFKNFSKKC
jgi:hypothetical protein